MEDNDAQLHLKKRARRRLVGAVFFVSVVAVVLPMVMDHEPRQTVQDVEIRIPGQDEKPFAPKLVASPVEKSSAKSAETAPVVPAAKVDEPVPVKPTARVVEVVKDGKTVDKSGDVSAEKLPEKPAPKADKVVEKPVVKPVEKPVDKAVEKVAEKPRDDDAKRAAAILAGQSADNKSPQKAGEYLVLIGAFANEANVTHLKAKLTEQGIKTFTEPLNTPQGKKTRVRAGPFATREAAEKALEKMKRIGVSGVISAKP